MSHSIRCACGSLQGAVTKTAPANHCVCYCRDCQAFAHFLGRAVDALDAQGGVKVIQVPANHVEFSAGADNLACIRLTNKGLLRWYASCCNTPIGATFPTMKLSFVGLIHSCLENDEPTIEQSFGPVGTQVNVQHAKGEPIKQRGLAIAIARLMRMLLWARLNGSYRQTPFFQPTGTPIVEPVILDDQQRRTLMREV